MKTTFLTFAFIICTALSIGQTTKIMSYNIRYNNQNDKENWWENRKESVVDLIQFYEPDIFGIQEGLHGQTSYLDNNLPNYNYIGVGRDDGKTKGEYSAIFYNKEVYKPVKEGTFWLSETPDKVSVGWDASMERICTYGLFKHLPSGKEIWVFNAHYDHIGTEAREKSSSLILDKIKEFNTQGLPVVLTGDFNSTPDSKAILTYANDLEDTFSNAAKKHYGPIGTFNGFDASHPLDKRIDYVFAKDISILSHIHIDDKRVDGFFVSDHLPVLATLEFK